MIRKYLNGFRPDFSVIKNFQKVFWVFNFGHFFCPFSEIQKKFWEKNAKIGL
jgi:hypothetical protein